MQHTTLTNNDKNICEYGGVIGILLSLTCLIQHFILAIPGPITYPMIPVYLCALSAFIVLTMQRAASIVLLILSFVLLFVVNVTWMKHFSFSLAVLLLLVYALVAIIILFVEKIPSKLKLKEAAEKAEKDSWADKI